MRTVARDIQLSQQQQAGQMYRWLEQWGLGQGRTEPVTAWMAGGGIRGGVAGMEGGATENPAGDLGSVGAMPGMATEAQMAALTSADGVEAERIYLQLMATHHVAGVEMAQVAAAEASDPQVRRLAETIARGQQAGIVVLQDLLAERGGPVEDA